MYEINVDGCKEQARVTLCNHLSIKADSSRTDRETKAKTENKHKHDKQFRKQWRRQDLLRGGAKIEIMSWPHSRWTSGPVAAAAR